MLQGYVSCCQTTVARCSIHLYTEGLTICAFDLILPSSLPFSELSVWIANTSALLLQDVKATEAALRTGVKLAHDAAAGAKMDPSQQVSPQSASILPLDVIMSTVCEAGMKEQASEDRLSFVRVKAEHFQLLLSQ